MPAAEEGGQPWPSLGCLPPWDPAASSGLHLTLTLPPQLCNRCVPVSSLNSFLSPPHTLRNPTIFFFLFFLFFVFFFYFLNFFSFFFFIFCKTNSLTILS